MAKKSVRDKERYSQTLEKSIETILGKTLISPKTKYYLPTRIGMLDVALSGKTDEEQKGFPGGKWIRLVGDPNTGKSLILYFAAAEIISRGGRAVFIDTENRFNEDLACRTGYDLTQYTDQFFLSIPSTLDEALKLVETMIDQAVLEYEKDQEQFPWLMIAIDSIATLGAKAEEEAKDSNGEVAVRPMAQASLWAKFSRSKYTRIIANKPIWVFMSNQLRDNVDFNMHPGVVKKEREPGGRALKYQTSIKIDTSSRKLNLSESEKASTFGDTSEGVELCYKIDKAFGGLPGLTVRVPWFYRWGVDYARMAMDFFKQRDYQQADTRVGKEPPVEWTSQGRMIWDGKSQFSGAWFQFFGDNEEKLNEFISLAEREYLAYTQYAIG